MGSRDETAPHQPLLSSLVVRSSYSGGGGGSDYKPGEVRRDAPPYSRPDRYYDDPGKLCKIPYGSGFIAGFFSQDNVGVGNKIVKDQVFAEALTERSVDLIFKKFDGILGLGFQDMSVGSAAPIWSLT